MRMEEMKEFDPTHIRPEEEKGIKQGIIKELQKKDEYEKKLL